MAETRYELKVYQRTERGKQEIKKLRAEDWVPVVFYSHGTEAVSLKMTYTDVREALNSGERIFNINIDGEQRRAVIKDLQFHPVTDKILHIDLHGVRLRDVVEIEVPVVLVGTPVGVKEQGGVLQHTIHELTIRCKGSDVPEHIEVDVSKLEIGDSIHIRDLKTEIWTILEAEDIALVIVQTPQKMEIEAPVAEEEEYEEGEEPEEDEESETKKDED